MLMTGSPIPLWHTERLNHPVPIKKVTDQNLILVDGRSVSLPFIKRLPRNDPAFLKALSRGVEVGGDGEVVGLVTVHPYCGNDAFLWYTFRINLSDLAGCVDPDGIDNTIVPAVAIKDLKENQSRTRDRDGLPRYVMNKARKMREIYEASKAAPGASRIEGGRR